MRAYMNELNGLVRSILIKSSHQATAINDNIINKYGENYVAADYRTWRYYLNLNGQYHFTNDEMEIYVIELNTVEKLTKELLVKYKKTREDLSRYGITYKKLLKTYPNNELLIKGMITPVDMETAYTAVDGTILCYSKYYADPNDDMVLRKVSRYLERIYVRWFNPAYIETEEYYVAEFLAYLYSTLHTKIDIIRMENIHTHMAHSYHVNNFFKSHLNLDVSFLNYKSKLWLYQNLRAVMTNNGATETFQQLLDNVITPNQVGVGKVVINKAKPQLLEANLNNPYKPMFTTDNVNQLLVENLNEHYYLDGMSLAEITAIEVNNGYIHETQFMDLNELVDRVRTRINDNNDINLETKVIHLLGKEDRDILPFPRINMVLDNLFHIGSKAECEYEINYTDPVTSNVYKMTMHQAIRLLGHYLMAYGGKETEVMSIGSKSVFLRDDIDISGLLIPDGTNFRYMTILDEYRPLMNMVYFNSDDVATYISEGIDYFTMEWIMKSSVLNQVAIANMDVLNRYRCFDIYDLEINHVEDEIGLIKNENYDYIEAIKGLITTITNGRLMLDLNEVNQDSINSYVSLLSKTTSYNIQIIGSSTTSNSLHMFDPGIGEITAPVLITFNGYLNGLENLEGDLKTGIIPKVRANTISDDRYYLASELVPMNGRATGEYRMLKERFYLVDRSVSINAINIADDTYSRMSDVGPMNGQAVSPSNMIRKIKYQTQTAGGDFFGAGGTFKLELKKESDALEKPITYNSKELVMGVVGGGGYFTTEEKLNKEEE